MEQLQSPGEKYHRSFSTNCDGKLGGRPLERVKIDIKWEVWDELDHRRRETVIK